MSSVTPNASAHFTHKRAKANIRDTGHRRQIDWKVDMQVVQFHAPLLPQFSGRLTEGYNCAKLPPMFANLLTEPGKLEYKEVPTPTAGEGEIVVRVQRALTCGTDIKAFRRGHPKWPMPTLFGHEFAGDCV